MLMSARSVGWAGFHREAPIACATVPGGLLRMNEFVA